MHHPLQCCVRELKEEAGLDALSVEYLGASASDAGRLMNRQHIFRVKASEPSEKFIPEPGTEVRCISHDELRQLIHSGAFPHQLHLAVLFRCGFTL